MLLAASGAPGRTRTYAIQTLGGSSSIQLSYGSTEVSYSQSRKQEAVKSRVQRGENTTPRFFFFLGMVDATSGS